MDPDWLATAAIAAPCPLWAGLITAVGRAGSGEAPPNTHPKPP